MPIEPPTCWAVLKVAEAAPASRGATLAVASEMEVIIAVPMPRPSMSMPGRMCEAYAGADPTCAMIASAPAASSSPGTMRARGGTRFRRRAATCVEPVIMPTVMGR